MSEFAFLHNTPGFLLVEQAAADFLGSIRADGAREMLPATPDVICPQCGTVQEPACCSKCGDCLCDKCDPDSEMHVRCLPPERVLPYRLLTDCRLEFLRISGQLSQLRIRGYHLTEIDCAYQIARNGIEMLEKGGIR